MSGFLPKHNRRLSDILLAAFSHAYAVGERDIADRLRALLEELDGRRLNGSEKRQQGGAVRQADRWVAFVDARDRYRELCETGGEGGKAQSALSAMKDSYRRWTLG